MIKLFLAGLLILCIVYSGISQEQNTSGKIRRISIFKDFEERGYTTAGASTHFEYLKRNNVELQVISSEYRERLALILNKAQKKSHFQTKFGIRNIFAEIEFAISNLPHKIVISQPDTFYNSKRKHKEKRVLIVDLTDAVNYKISISEDVKWLDTFINKLMTNEL